MGVSRGARRRRTARWTNFLVGKEREMGGRREEGESEGKSNLVKARS